MESAGKWSILVIYSGYSVDTEYLITEAAGRGPINESYDPHEGKRVMEFQYKTEQGAKRARARMAAARMTIEPPWKRPWVGKVRHDDFEAGPTLEGGKI